MHHFKTGRPSRRYGFTNNFFHRTVGSPNFIATLVPTYQLVYTTIISGRGSDARGGRIDIRIPRPVFEKRVPRTAKDPDFRGPDVWYIPLASIKIDIRRESGSPRRSAKVVFHEYFLI